MKRDMRNNKEDRKIIKLEGNEREKSLYEI